MKAFEFGQKARPHISASASIKKALPCKLRQRSGLGRNRDRQILRQQSTARFMSKIFKEKSPPILKAFEFGQKARTHISASPSIKKTPPL